MFLGWFLVRDSGKSGLFYLLEILFYPGQSNMVVALLSVHGMVEKIILSKWSCCKLGWMYNYDCTETWLVWYKCSIDNKNFVLILKLVR